jgi:crotonobetainyl-CoA:carnitine CoA-transferase CaiB-like acyl-CoA transferase
MHYLAHDGKREGWMMPERFAPLEGVLVVALEQAVSAPIGPRALSALAERAVTGKGRQIMVQPKK